MAVQRLEDSFEVAGVTMQACFDFIVDTSNGSEWASFAHEIIGHGVPGLGQRVEARIGFLGVTFGVDTHVVTWDEPHVYVLSGRAPFRGEIGARLERADGGTLVRSHLEVDPGRFFPVPGIVLRRALRHQFDKDVAALRRCLHRLG